MTFVGIVGARKYRNRQSVEDLVVHLAHGDNHRHQFVQGRLYLGKGSC